MNRTVATIIIIIFALALIGTFGAWWYVSYYSAPPLVNDTPPTPTPPPPTIFPPSEAKPTPAPSGAQTSPGMSELRTASTTTKPSITRPTQSFNELSEEPVIAAFPLGNQVIFATRADGHLFALDPDLKVSRLANTTITKTWQVRGGLASSTPAFAFQVETAGSGPGWLFANFQATASSSPLIFLSEGRNETVAGQLQLSSPNPTIREIVASPDDQQLISVESFGQSTRLRRRAWSTNTWTDILNLPLRELSVSWPATSTLVLQTKPSAEARGVAWLYDLRSQRLKMIINNVLGLASVASPNGRYMMYSGVNAGALFSGLYNLETQSVSRLPFTTMAEKCTWSLQNQLYCAVPTGLEALGWPDAWYRGEVSSNDRLWQFDPSRGASTLIYDPKADNLKVVLDAFNLFTNQNSGQLFLLNKTDRHLWALNLLGAL